MKAVIAGGGIGGLTAGLCLQHYGWQVTVLERATRLEEIGAGLQLSPNACHVLARLGLLDPLEPLTFAPERIEMRFGKSGRNIFSIPLRDAALKRWGAPYLHLHRADLVDALAGALTRLDAGGLQYARQVQGYQVHEHGVLVQLASGEVLEADLLVGADGIHSAVQTCMLGEQTPRYTGNVAWRMTVPVEGLGEHAPPPTACVWAGAGRHAVTYLLKGGRLANFVGVVEQADWVAESWTARGSREKALEDFAGWHPVITTLIEQSDRHYQWALFDREPLTRWTDQRVALLGDACHPMLPFLAQGAAMAIEDAWVLASQLAAHDDIATALHAYQQQRKQRTRRAQMGARANMKRFHHRHAFAYLPYWLAGRLAPGFVHGRQDWLYGVNVTHAIL